MTGSLYERIRRILNEELIKRMLTKYFVEKGIAKENFNSNIYPPIIQDLTARIPQLVDKVEIEASVRDFNPQSGRARLDWNIFVLGNQRMHIGESTHANLSELKQVTIGQMNKKSAVKNTSPKRIIEFITRILGQSEDGFIDPKQGRPSVGSPGKTGPGASSKFYAGSQGFELNRPVL